MSKSNGRIKDWVKGGSGARVTNGALHIRLAGGGTGNSLITGLEPGQVLFGSATGGLDQDPQLLWDDTTKQFTVVAGTQSQPFIVLSNSDTGNFTGNLVLRKSRGTFAAPTGVAANDIVGRFDISAHNGTQYQSTAQIRFFVTAAYTAGTRPPVGLNVFTSAGGLQIGTLNITADGVRVSSTTGTGTVALSLLHIDAGTSQNDAFRVAGTTGNSAFGEAPHATYRCLVSSPSDLQLALKAPSGQRFTTLFLLNDTSVVGFFSHDHTNSYNMLGYNTTRMITWDDSGAVIGVNQGAHETGALLALASTTATFRKPRMTSTQRDNLTAVEGDEIFNLTTHAPQYYNGTIWV